MELTFGIYFFIFFGRLSPHLLWCQHWRLLYCCFFFYRNRLKRFLLFFHLQRGMIYFILSEKIQPNYNFSTCFMVCSLRYHSLHLYSVEYLWSYYCSKSFAEKFSFFLCFQPHGFHFIIYVAHVLILFLESLVCLIKFTFETPFLMEIYVGLYILFQT